MNTNTDKPLSERSQSEKDLVTLAAMKKHGWSFIKSLGELYSHADKYDRMIIRKTWKDAWENYSEIGEREVGEVGFDAYIGFNK